jgi:hypothetical protein
MKLGEHWVRDVAGWAYIMLAIMVLALVVSWLVN